MQESGIGGELLVTQAGEVLDHLRHPDGLVRTNAAGLNVVLVRFSDLGTPAAARRWIEEFGSTLRLAVADGGAPTIVLRCPDAPAWEDPSGTAELEALLLEVLRVIPGVEFLPGATVTARCGPAAEAGPSPEWFASLATLVVRRAHAALRPAYRVLVVGCDDVLWSGRCGEVAPESLVIDDHRRALQRFLHDRAREGWLVCLSGRKYAADVRRVFARRSDMPLSLDDIAATQFDWTPPSERLCVLAGELGMDVGSMVVLTANEAECEDIRAQLPGVPALAVPGNPARLMRFLESLWALDRSPLAPRAVSDDPCGSAVIPPSSAPRTISGARIDVAVAENGELDRLSDLTRKARHFNTTGGRVTAAEFSWFARQRGREVLAVRVSDRGCGEKTVGVLRVRRLRDALRIDDWWMDDAAMGRGLEGHVLRAVGRRAVAAGVPTVELAHVPSHRNEPVRRFFGALGVECSRGEYLVPIGVALAAGGAESSPERSRRPAGVDFYRRAAGALSTPGGVLRAISRRGLDSDGARAAPYRLPRTHTERWLSGVWRELLGVERVGAQDDFFALGGDSLAGARSIARVRSAFGVSLPLRGLYEEPTLEAQAARLMRARLAHADPNVVRSLLAEEAGGAEAA